MSQVTLSVVGEKEVSDLLSSVLVVVADLAAGKTIAQVAADSLPALLQDVGEAKAALADVKSDPVGCAMSVVVFVPQLIAALKPLPAPAPAA